MAKTKTNKNNNKHLRPQRGLGQAVSRQRRRATDQLKRESESRRKRERDIARRLLSQRESQNPEQRAEAMWRHNLLKATIDHQSAVMKSYGINVPVDARIDTGWWGRPATLKAWTDHKSITIRFPENLFPADRTNNDALMDGIATLRGVFQHELGHIRFTVPFTDLKFGDDANIGDLVPSQLHWPWNCLEDQRMETAVVKGVPRLASYFTTMIVEHIVKGDGADRSWLLLAGRTYLPTVLRQQSRDLFVKVYGESLAQRWEAEVQTYIGATTHAELRASVIRAHALLSEIMSDLPEPSIDEHWGEGGIADPSDGASDVDNDDLDKGESGDGEGTGEESNGDASDDEGAGNGESDAESDKDGEAGDGTTSSNDGDESNDSGSEGKSTDADGADSDQDDEARSSGNGATTGSLDTDNLREEMKRTMREVMDEATQDIRQDDINNDILKDANQLTNDTGSIPFLTGHSYPMPADMQAEAEALAVGMENALNDFVTASQPVWMSHQEHGIIDPIAFRTKSVGDMDYRRGLTGDFTEGLDIHVSLLCDASVSMQGDPMEALSKVIYATSKACDNLGIGLTTTLWSSDSDTYRISPEDVGTPTLYETLGGTNPTDALDDLDSHDIGNVENHLVIIFTDGDWDAQFPGVQNWERPGRHTVLIHYNEWWRHHPNILGRTSDTRGCDEAFRIGDILNLPMEMTNAIAGLLSK